MNFRWKFIRFSEKNMGIDRKRESGGKRQTFRERVKEIEMVRERAGEREEDVGRRII